MRRESNVTGSKPNPLSLASENVAGPRATMERHFRNSSGGKRSRHSWVAALVAIGCSFPLVGCASTEGWLGMGAGGSVAAYAYTKDEIETTEDLVLVTALGAASGLMVNMLGLMIRGEDFEIPSGLITIVEEGLTPIVSSAAGVYPGVTDVVPQVGDYNKALGVMNVATGLPVGAPVRIHVFVRDHECEDGDIVEVGILRGSTREVIFSGEIFNTWQSRTFTAQAGYHYTIVAAAVNGMGDRGDCEVNDVNTGEMYIAYDNNREESAIWRAPGGSGSAGVINVLAN